MNAQHVFDAFLDGEEEPSRSSLEAVCHRHPEHAEELRNLWGAYTRAAALADRVRPPRAPASVPADRYRVRGEIAHGGMGRVLEVWDTELRRTLAMKVLRSRPDRTELGGVLFDRHTSRLVNEAQVLGQLEHPGIVPIHELGTDEAGHPYFTMLRVRGRPLTEIFEDVRAERNGWSMTRAVGVLLRVCEAMAHAHSKGVIHRDLKPANIMVGPFGEVFVMDWGLAKARGVSGAADLRLREAAFSAPSKAPSDGRDGPLSVRTDRRDQVESDSVSPLMTMDGDVVGTPAYMSPEQADGRLELVDERSDVYGVGATLYHLLTGARPYASHTADVPRQLLAVVRTEGPPALSATAPDAPVELIAICEKAMARERVRRYETMKSLADDLHAWVEGRVVRAHRTGPWAELFKWTMRHRVPVALLTLLAVVASTSTVVFAILYRRSEELRVSELTLRGNAIRRGLRSPTAFGGPPLPTFVEEFEGDRLDRRWVVTGGPARVRCGDGGLSLESAPNEATGLSLDPFVNVLAGDFDIELDFSLVGFDVKPVPRSERVASLYLHSLSTSEPDVTEHFGKPFLIQLARHAEYRSRVTPGLEQTCWAEDYRGRLVFVEQDTSRGRFRVRREGSRITAYTWQESWLELLSGDYSREDLGLALFLTQFYIDAPAVFRIERFSARTSAAPLEKVVRSVKEDFSSPTIAPELRLRHEAAAAAVVDGKLRLWKVEGRPGEIELFLDRHRGHVLRGDFDVSVRFDLEEFPVPEVGFAELQLQAFTPQQGRFATVRLLAEEGTTSYDAYYHAERKSTPFAGSVGGLSIRRRGNRIESRVWSDGWQPLQVRPEVNGAPDMLFAIRLLTDGEESYVVWLDDLAASSTPWPGSKPPR
jgi:serine/threonine protein kinase